MGLVNLGIYYNWKNIRSAYNNNKFKILLPLGMMNSNCSMVLIQFMAFKITLNLLSKKKWNFSWKSSHIYPNEIKNRIIFKIKTGCKLELSSPETTKLSGSTKKMLIKIKMGKMYQKPESVEVVLVHCNLVNNSYQQSSKVLFTFLPNKQFGQLITILSDLLTILKTTNSEFHSIQVWSTD